MFARSLWQQKVTKIKTRLYKQNKNIGTIRLKSFENIKFNIIFSKY